MKVLFIIDSLGVGGAERSIAEIAANFKEFTPVVCHLFNNKDLKHIYDQHRIKVISLDLPKSYKDAQILPKLLEIVKSENPDLIHASLYRSMMLSRKIKTVIKIPLVNSFVSDSYSSARFNRLKLKTKLKLKYYQFIDRSSAKIADVFISNSQAIAGSNCKALKLKSDKVKVIHRGRNFEKFSNVDERKVENVKVELGLKNKKVFLNVGRLLESKGQQDVIYAFKDIASTHPEAILLLAGEGNYRSVLEKLISEYSLENRVFLLGQRNDIEVLLSVSDYFVFSSYFEGLPGALLEAMMAGKIIIAGNIPENRECVDETSALFFNPGNVKQLRELMQKVLNNSDNYKHLGSNAKNIAAAKFDIKMISALYEETYKNIISKS